MIPVLVLIIALLLWKIFSQHAVMKAKDKDHAKQQVNHAQTLLNMMRELGKLRKTLREVKSQLGDPHYAEQLINQALGEPHELH